MRSELFTNLKHRGFAAPAINCLPGSAWHGWASQGAFYSASYPGECVETAAQRFASGREFNHLEASPAYKARKRAFLEGATG